jgi:hypothetical protein
LRAERVRERERVERDLGSQEALLRADAGNWCIVNDGAPDPSVVLGISGRASFASLSKKPKKPIETCLNGVRCVGREYAPSCAGKPHALVDVAAAHRDGIQVIKRFSGGGTVIVDADTQARGVFILYFVCLIQTNFVFLSFLSPLSVRILHPQRGSHPGVTAVPRAADAVDGGAVRGRRGGGRVGTSSQRRCTSSDTVPENRVGTHLSRNFAAVSTPPLLSM